MCVQIKITGAFYLFIYFKYQHEKVENIIPKEMLYQTKKIMYKNKLNKDFEIYRQIWEKSLKTIRLYLIEIQMINVKNIK